MALVLISLGLKSNSSFRLGQRRLARASAGLPLGATQLGWRANLDKAQRQASSRYYAQDRIVWRLLRCHAAGHRRV